MISGLPMTAALMIMAGVGLHLQEADPSLSASRTVVAMVFIYMIFFSFAWGPTVWVVCSEISTGRNRSKLMTMSTSVNWFFNWLVSFVFPYLFNADAANLQTKVGFIYGSLTLAAVVWVFFLLPEPAGRSLEEIDYLFEKHVPARKFACTYLTHNLPPLVHFALNFLSDFFKIQPQRSISAILRTFRYRSPPSWSVLSIRFKAHSF